ncbi:MAG TPA: hypothetical protein VFS64_05440 [Solirubrobacterales bacterium]|nr:hypothetical protein [Solirubrobacterales bacterium]
MFGDLSKGVKASIGGPLGLFFAIVVALTATNSLGNRTLGVLLAWYATIGWIGYAGRLPIHVRGCGYVSRRPRDHPATRGRRQRLNLLVALNLISIVLWGLLCLYLHRHVGDPSLVLRAVLTVALFAFVFAIAIATVRVINDPEIDLQRGTEWICASKLGQGFLEVDKHIPKRPPFGPLFKRFKEVTTRTEISAFFILVSCSLLALPISGFGAPAAGRLVARELNRGEETTTKQHHTGSGKELLYDEECEGLPWAGVPAPAPQRQQLHALWLGGFGLGLAGDGAKQAGCAHAARQVPGQPGAYYVPSFCGEELRSIGVTSDEYLPSLLYSPAAGFVLQLAKAGVLLGASRRHSVRGGDYYMVDSSFGSWVLVRRNTSTGSGDSSDGSLSCEHVAADNVRYQRVPPGLFGIWFELAGREWVWPEQVGLGSGAGEFEFRSEDPTAAPLATADCATPTYCTAVIEGEPRSTSGSLYTTVQAINEMAR